jgi:L-alanine-DL-glutamate epimerase-like enolase superfamily enzyme
MKMKIEKIPMALKSPFIMTGYTFTTLDTVRVTLEVDGVAGRGESLGIYYKNETAGSMIKQLEQVKSIIHSELSLDEVQKMLPAGGARNALDCALWDLELKRNNISVWDRVKISPKKLVTVATICIDSPEAMAIDAQKRIQYPILKIKLSNDAPIERLEAIRQARPDATIIVDVNQGWTFAELKKYTPAAKKLGIAMIEQPLARGADEELTGYKSPVKLGADESCLSLSEYKSASLKYDVINIKLDKCGGLTEALKIVQCAMQDGKELMVGNMIGSTSLSMAPAYVIGQFCSFVDIDGPLFLQEDIDDALTYNDGGIVSLPSQALWG